MARQFLTTGSSTSWVPERGTVVYGNQQLVAGPGGVVTLRLRDVVELDDRGAWRGDPTSGRGHDYRLRLVKEDGEWRISHPPNRLLIPRAHLDTQYQQFLLYFFGRSAQVLVPEPVYVPRGRQAPTLLVAGLLKGPEPHLGDVERTFLPPGTSLDGISVPVTRDGTAEVPLQRPGARRGQPRAEAAVRADRLDSGPGARRATAAGHGVRDARSTCPGRPRRAGVGDFSEFDPSVAWASTALFGVRDRRVVTFGSQGEDRVSGPFGTLALGPRSIAVDPLAQHIAEVSADGRTVLEADRDGVPGRAARMSDTRPVYTGGTDVLRPAYDLYGQLWVVDRTPSGGRLSVVRNGVARTELVPGLSGAQVTRFVLSRDGTRLVAELRRAGRDDLVVARVRRDTRGRVVSVAGARRLEVDGVPDRIQDIAWRTPTDLAVLAGAHARYVRGAAGQGGRLLDRDRAQHRGCAVPGSAVRLVTSPSRETSLYVATSDGRLYALSSRGRWQASSIKPGLRAPTFAG